MSDLHFDIAGYDGFIAGLVERALTGSNIPARWRDSFRLDDALLGRARRFEDDNALGADELVAYLEKMRPMIHLARRCARLD